MTPRVSVIIPAFCCEKTIEGCIRSVLTGTEPDVEIVVVNDSPIKKRKGLDAVLKRLSEEDKRIRVLNIYEDIGVAEARNRGVAAAQADWVAFLDSDDLWEPDKLSIQLKTAEQTGAAIVYTAAACIDRSGEKTGKVFSVPKTITANKLLFGNDIITSTVLVRREPLLKYPMERSDLHEDFICWYRILKDGAIAAGVNEQLARYRITEDSKSGNKRKSAAMTWNTYRYLGVGFFRRIVCFAGYCLHGVKRYWL